LLKPTTTAKKSEWVERNDVSMLGIKKKKTPRQVALQKVTKLQKEPNGANDHSNSIPALIGIVFVLLIVFADLYPAVRIARSFGTMLMVLCTVGAFGFYLARRDGWKLNTGKVLVIVVQLLVISVFARIASAGRISPFLIPLALAAILSAIVYGDSLGISVAMFGAFLTAIALNSGVEQNAGAQIQNLNVAIILATGGAIGALIGKDINTRATPVVAGLIIAGVYVLMTIGTGMIMSATFISVFYECVFGALNGIATGFIIAGTLPFIEKVFGVTTNIRLRELSDLNHPLLKTLAMNAPGTYHHSLIVGSLAEAAAVSIGANPLLARVGSYYHDVGKANKPSYFVENQADGDSKHENLSPAMSTLIIVSHSKDGLELANEYGLPGSVKEIIAEHHGTTLVEYFYSQAKDRKDSDDVPKEETYRYPGPKPQSKEAAIVLLADSVESSTRTLDEISPSKLENHVHGIVNNKLHDGQLDRANLTLCDISNIETSFVKTLANLYHARIKYPSQVEKEEEEAKSAENSS